MTGGPQTVLFVCAHGAYRSRLASGVPSDDRSVPTNGTNAMSRARRSRLIASRVPMRNNHARAFAGSRSAASSRIPAMNVSCIRSVAASRSPVSFQR